MFEEEFANLIVVKGLEQLHDAGAQPGLQLRHRRGGGLPGALHRLHFYRRVLWIWFLLRGGFRGEI